jgi:hypothetical protein
VAGVGWARRLVTAIADRRSRAICRKIAFFCQKSSKKQHPNLAKAAWLGHARVEEATFSAR